MNVGSNTEILPWRASKWKSPAASDVLENQQWGKDSMKGAWVSVETCAISTWNWFIWVISIWWPRNKEYVLERACVSVLFKTQNTTNVTLHYFQFLLHTHVSGKQWFFWLNTLFQCTWCLRGSLLETLWLDSVACKNQMPFPHTYFWCICLSGSDFTSAFLHSHDGLSSRISAQYAILFFTHSLKIWQAGNLLLNA